MNHILESDSERATFELGERLARALASGDVVLLEGELGAGKTSLVRGLASGLGIDHREISSPTFTIVHEHEFPGGTLYHIDAYRLSGVEELETIAWDAIVDDPQGIVVCEWPQRIAAAVGDGTIRMLLRHVGPQQRDIEVRSSGDDAGRFESALGF